MRVYGLLLEELKFKKGHTPESFIDYFTENEEKMPGQAEAYTDDFGVNPYFGIVPVFTHSACDFDTLENADSFILDTILPFLDMKKETVKKMINFFNITSEG